jgi:hypothetical protein
MLSTPLSGSRLFVEPLEQRIAPTGLVAIANNAINADDPTYVTYTTQPAAGKLGFVPAAAYGVAGPANLYAIALNGDGSVTPGDRLDIFTSDGYRTFLQIPNGHVVAFFLDANNDLQVQNTELVGLSVGKKTTVNVNGNVNGDIVTNLANDGTLMLGSLGKPKQTIAGLNISGNVFGNILSGGDISNVAINGSVNAILAGTAVNGVEYHTGGPNVATGVATVPGPFDGRVGSSISNVSLLSVGLIKAGDGGVGAAGGRIAQLTLQGDTDGFQILSGNGGTGNDVTRGGTGGAIDGVVIKGVPDFTPNNLMLIQAGNGGANTAFKGGTGGSINGVGTSFESFDPISGAKLQSADLVADNIVLRAGDGGNGLRGGKGGSVSNSQLFGIISDDGVTNANGLPNAEIQVLGGNGGINTVEGDGSKAGKGGSVDQVAAENLSTFANAQTSTILVQGGAGGVVQAGGNGRIGGSVTGVDILGARLTVNGGNGSTGNLQGGAGGDVSDIRVLSLQNLFANAVTLNAGFGGNGNNGVGGAGGNVNKIDVADADLTSFIINAGTQGNGGLGGGGKGGAGGNVTGVAIGDTGAFRAIPGVATIRAGLGGNGARGAGAGGDVDTFQLLGTDLTYTVTAGNGGNVVDGGRGKGGNGGSLINVGVSNQPLDVANAQFSAGSNGTATSGAGGNGFGKGGKGGDVSGVNIRAAFDVSITAGAGGAGNAKAAGDGGSVIGAAGSSLFSFVRVNAGNAGAVGAAPGKGGSVNGFVAAAATDAAIIAGAGGVGGAGGDVLNSGTTFNTVTAAPNTGGLRVVAGAGSSGNGAAGAGGSISVFNGLIGQSGSTTFIAGVGGGGVGSDVSGAGGSIDQVKLTGPADFAANPVFVSFDAGDAGDADQTRRGAVGGSVTNVTLLNLGANTLVHHVAAGDGGDAARRGGAGGSVNEIHVGLPSEADSDIGVRANRGFGYQANAAGGIFTGLGGVGARSNGVAGDVTNVTATAIASIVAGKGAGLGLATNVDAIYLNGLTNLAANGAGAFTNFDTANLVGSSVNPTAAGASVYRAGDGLIAAINLTQARNFVPGALLTVDGSTLLLVDYRQPNPAPSITPA